MLEQVEQFHAADDADRTAAFDDGECIDIGTVMKQISDFRHEQIRRHRDVSKHQVACYRHVRNRFAYWAALDHCVRHLDSRFGLRSRNVESLKQRRAGVHKLGSLGGGFDALGNDGALRGASEIDDRPDELHLERVGIDVADEVAIDLYKPWMKLSDHARSPEYPEPRSSMAKATPEALNLGHHVADGVVVIEDGLLGEFEHQRLGWHA